MRQRVLRLLVLHGVFAVAGSTAECLHMERLLGSHAMSVGQVPAGMRLRGGGVDLGKIAQSVTGIFKGAVSGGKKLGTDSAGDGKVTLCLKGGREVLIFVEFLLKRKSTQGIVSSQDVMIFSHKR